MSTHARVLLAALAAAMLMFSGCKGEEEYTEPEAFSFVVYPGSRYLGQLTDTAKKVHKSLRPDQEPPPLVLVQIKLFDDHSLSSLAIGRLDRSEIFAAAAHDYDRLAGIWDWYVGPRRSD